MAIPGGIIEHVSNDDIMTYDSVAATAYTEGGFVKWSANQIVTPCTAENDAAIGVILTTWTTTENATQRPVQVVRRGLVWLQCAAAVTRGVYLHVGPTTFRAEGTTTGGEIIIGQCETAQATAGSTFLAYFDGFHLWPYRTS